MHTFNKKLQAHLDIYQSKELPMNWRSLLLFPR